MHDCQVGITVDGKLKKNKKGLVCCKGKEGKVVLAHN
jgi:hypothetical protein